MNANAYNPILDTDSYKAGSHHFLYPDDIDYVYSYEESRGGATPGVLNFGLQGWIKSRLLHRVTHEHIAEAAEFMPAHGLFFNREGWTQIVDKHDGFLPLDIRGIDEGLLVPTGTPRVSMQNTVPEMHWLVGDRETAMLRQVWYATAVATRVAYMKGRIKRIFEESGSDMGALDFALLDFSSRGCASYGANEIGGAAYLTCFKGSDSIPAVRYANTFYDCAMAGFSVPATEHSVMCSWGSDGAETIRELLRRVVVMRQGQPGGILSIVADTWNVYECAKTIAGMAAEFKDAGILAVIRPDSGDMDEVLPQVFHAVAEGFGTTRNDAGFHAINGAKVLQGDGITDKTVTVPFEIAKSLRISASSVMAGSGGGLMQHNIDRDTHKEAFKASAVLRRNATEWQGICKQPITDSGKRSKPGRHLVFRSDDGGWMTLSDVDAKSYDQNTKSMLKPRYLNGQALNETTLDQIRARVDSQF